MPTCVATVNNIEMCTKMRVYDKALFLFAGRFGI